MLVLLAALAAGVIFGVPRAYHWYLNLRHPLSPKAPVGSTIWSHPSGSVSMVMNDAPEWATRDAAITRQEADGKLTNPLPHSPQVIELGKKHFLAYCAHCHGSDGKAGGPVAKHAAFPPPNLTLSAARRSEGFLYATIRNGGVMMPPQGYALSPQERWETVHFLKSIAQAAPRTDTVEPAPGAAPPAGETPSAPVPTKSTPPARSPAAPAVAVTKGDAAKGKAVFDAKCGACHDATSDQEIVGPGLKDLFHWPPHQGPDGSQHAQHTVPMIRTQIVQGGGAMPPVTGLSEQDLADLLAYLQTL
jgi:mono/diheme cytochrome c family protein